MSITDEILVNLISSIQEEDGESLYLPYDVYSDIHKDPYEWNNGLIISPIGENRYSVEYNDSKYTYDGDIKKVLAKFIQYKIIPEIEPDFYVYCRQKPGSVFDFDDDDIVYALKEEMYGQFVDNATPELLEELNLTTYAEYMNS